MLDDLSSAQNSNWIYSPQQLKECRERANREAAVHVRALSAGLSSPGAGGGTSASKVRPTPPVRCFASGYCQRGGGFKEEGGPCGEQQAGTDGNSGGPQNPPPLDADEELLLVQFYAGKIPDLIGPSSLISRLRRDIKITATASALFRRFYLSNSVMLHDPKALMVASAFLASKVEDATVDVRYLAEATVKMQAPVLQKDIIEAEVSLIAGLNFELLCFHPYKTVLAYTEDLRTYLKTDRGRKLATFPAEDGAAAAERPIVGEDLRPMHDEARKIVDDAVVSDIGLLASPGQIGLAAMIVANDELLARRGVEGGSGGRDVAGEGGEQQTTQLLDVPDVDLLRYVEKRFDDRGVKDCERLMERIGEVRALLPALREGAYGCGNHGIDMLKLKAVHKRLKKCRVWGPSEEKKKKKKKKRKVDGETDTADATETKKVKLS